VKFFKNLLRVATCIVAIVVCTFGIHKIWQSGFSRLQNHQVTYNANPVVFYHPDIHTLELKSESEVVANSAQPFQIVNSSEVHRSQGERSPYNITTTLKPGIYTFNDSVVRYEQIVEVLISSSNNQNVEVTLVNSRSTLGALLLVILKVIGLIVLTITSIFAFSMLRLYD
jgi:hypothetical protein